MPFYKLVCRDCGEAFEKRASVTERAEKQITCPACGSVSLENDYSAGAAGFQIKMNQGTACPHSAECGCRCAGNMGGKVGCGG